jgi:hypothetical protein
MEWTEESAVVHIWLPYIEVKIKLGAELFSTLPKVSLLNF